MGDRGSFRGLGRSPGEGNSYPLQYSGLENSVQSMGSQRVRHNKETFTTVKEIEVVYKKLPLDLNYTLDTKINSKMGHGLK